jgi:uncharacterized protein with FMN-binding domain
MFSTLRSRPVRIGSALVGVAGALALAGCAGTTTTGDAGGSGSDSGSGSGDTSAAYTDGTYTAEGSYSTPETVEEITVTVTLEDDVITDVEVTGNPQAAESQRYQGEFIDGIAAEVEGKDIDEISVSRVAGSSLTSGGFNQAIDAIKAEAAA